MVDGKLSYIKLAIEFKDKLTSYNGSTITYDEIGNPISDGTWSYTWTQGRKLQQISKSGTTASYKYNSDGIRTEKTVNGVTTVYNVVGGQVTWEKTGSNNPIYYLYDASGELWGLKYTDNSMYFYVRNAQGDITKIVNKDGTEVVAYAYDAWGNLMSTTGSLASTLGVANPYRYRGYRVDNETGLYYLGSRYYNPVTLRYLNADGVVGADGDLLGSNMFAYCKNNPVMMVDPSGCWPTWGQIFTAVTVVAVAAVIVVAVVASAGTVGIALGVAAAGAGATGSMVGAAITIGTVGTYAVAAGIGACALSNAGEVLTGTNVIRDKVMGGNQGAYDTLQTGLAIAGGGAIAVGATKPGISGKAATPSKNAKVMHSLPQAGKAFTSTDKLYAGKPGEFQRIYYDFRGNASLRIDFTSHSPGSGHTNPHLHYWDPTIGRIK